MNQPCPTCSSNNELFVSSAKFLNRSQFGLFEISCSYGTLCWMLHTGRPTCWQKRADISIRDFGKTDGSLTNSAKNIHEDLLDISLFPCFI